MLPERDWASDIDQFACSSFQDALAVKILLDLLNKGLWSYGGFKLTGSGCTQIFSAP